jgi:hypothetical protein
MLFSAPPPRTPDQSPNLLPFRGRQLPQMATDGVCDDTPLRTGPKRRQRLKRPLHPGRQTNTDLGVVPHPFTGTGACRRPAHSTSTLRRRFLRVRHNENLKLCLCYHKCCSIISTSARGASRTEAGPSTRVPSRTPPDTRRLVQGLGRPLQSPSRTTRPPRQRDHA